MPWKYRKSVKIAGMRLNFGKNGLTSISHKNLFGQRVTTNRNGKTTRTTTIKGTGLSYSTTSYKNKKKAPVLSDSAIGGASDNNYPNFVSQYKRKKTTKDKIFILLFIVAFIFVLKLNTMYSIWLISAITFFIYHTYFQQDLLILDKKTNRIFSITRSQFNLIKQKEKLTYLKFSNIPLSFQFSNFDSFMAQYEESIYLIEHSTTPSVFFERYYFALKTLDRILELSEDPRLNYTGTDIKEMKKKIIDNKPEFINDFLNRYKYKLGIEVNKLKTVNGKINKIKKLKADLIIYKEEINNEQNKLIDSWTLESFN